MNSIDDLDFEAVQKQSPFQIEEQEEKYRIIVRGNVKELSELISLFIDPTGNTKENFITGESFTKERINYQRIYFWGDHIILQTQGPTNELKEIRYFKNNKPTTYKTIDLYNKVYNKNK